MELVSCTKAKWCFTVQSSPTMTNQTFDGAVLRVQEYIDNDVSVASHSAHGAQEHDANFTTAVSDEVDRRMALSAQGSDVRPTIKAPRLTAPTTPRANTSKYCYYHGKFNHVGAECKVMREKLHHDFGTPFTQAMKNAKSASAVAGGCNF